MSNLVYQSKKILYVFTAFIFSFFYISYYISFPNDILRDRSNYILYALNFESITDDRSGSISFYFNEPLFLLINKILSFFFTAENIPIVFVLFNTIILMFFLSKKSINIVFYLLGLLVVVFTPYIFQGQLTALRQSLATSFFMLAFFYIKDAKKVLLVGCFCGLVHSIFFLISFFYFLNFIFLEKKSFNVKMSFTFIAMFIVSLSFFLIAELFGLRQANVYSEVDSKIGGGSFVLFLLVYIALYFKWSKILDDKLYLFVMIGLVLFLTGYFLTPLSGRLFNTFSLFLLLFLVSANSKFNIYILFLLITIFSYLYFNGGYNDILLFNYNSFLDLISEIRWLDNWGNA